jgi:hypothetical protein
VKRSATLPLLHLIQEDVGHISDDAITWIAQKLELQPINVLEVVTFYPMFRRAAIGRGGDHGGGAVNSVASRGMQPGRTLFAPDAFKLGKFGFAGN